MQFVVVLENDEGITLAASDQSRMVLPSDSVSMSVDSSELDTVPSQGDSLPTGTSCSEDRDKVVERNCSHYSHSSRKHP